VSPSFVTMLRMCNDCAKSSSKSGQGGCLVKKDVLF
jgi:hypothetical protein